MTDHDQDPNARVGGRSAFDDAARPIVSSAVSGLLDLVLDSKPIEMVLQHLSPSVRQAASLLPMGVSFGFAKLPMNLFPSESAAHFLQDVVVEMARHLDRKIKSAGGDVTKMTPEEYGEAVKEGLGKALESLYVLDPAGLLHKHDCARIGAYQTNQQPRTDKNGQPIPNRSQLRSISINAALAQQVPVAPCCFHGIREELQKPAETTKAAPKAPPKSPAEVIARATEEQRKVFMDWYASRDEAGRARVQELLRHLDSTEELDGLLYVIKNHGDVAEDMLTMMENANGSYTVGKYLEQFGHAAKNAAKETLHLLHRAYLAYRRWDETFEPTVKKLRANNTSASPVSTLKVLGLGRKSPRKGFLASLFDL